MNIAPPSYEALADLNLLQVFLFGIYPYIALVVAILGSWARFDLSQYSWKTSFFSNATAQIYACG